MGQESLNQMLHQGIAAARAGQHEAARSILQNVVRLDPRNEIAWMWLSSVAADDTERLFCLRKLLEVNPGNEFALKGLRALGVEPGRGSGELAGGTVIPTLDEVRYARILQAVDEFLRQYQAGPAMEGTVITWSHKRKGRYAESGATRIRQAMMAAALVLMIVVLGGGLCRPTGQWCTGGAGGTGSPPDHAHAQSNSSSHLHADKGWTYTNGLSTAYGRATD